MNAEDLPDDMEAIAMGDKCLMYRSSILEASAGAGGGGGGGVRRAGEGCGAGQVGGLAMRHGVMPDQSHLDTSYSRRHLPPQPTPFPSSVCHPFPLLQEKATAVNMLSCYAEELKEGFWAYVGPVLKLVLNGVEGQSPLIKFYLNEEVGGVWAG